MTRRLAASTGVLLLLVASLFSFAGAQNTPEITPLPARNLLLVADAFVRSGPDESFVAVGRLVPEAPLTALNRSEDGRWVLIRYNRGFGWIRRDLALWIVDIDALPVLASHLTPTPVAGAETATPFFPTPTPTGDYVRVNAVSAYLRGGPGVTYLRLDQLFPGDPLEPTGRNSDTSWILIRHGDGFAWIRRDLGNWTSDLDALPVLSEDDLTPTPTFTASHTATRTPTPSRTPSATATQTSTSTPQPTATDTPSPEPTATDTHTPSPTPTDTPSPEPTATQTQTPSPTATETPTTPPTATETLTPAPSATQTETAQPTTTETPLPDPTATQTDISAQDAVASAEALLAQLSPTAATETSTSTPQPTATHTVTHTHTAEATATATEAPTDAPTLTATPSPTQEPTLTETPEDTPAPEATTPPVVLPADATLTLAPLPTNTDAPDAEPTETETPDPTAAAVVITVTPAPPTSVPPPTPIPEIAASAGNSLRPELLAGLGLLLLILGYVALYMRGAATANRYAGGFVIDSCPVCGEGKLIVESRTDRSLGIPATRHVIRCDHCRSVLRESGGGRWRYAVDRAVNPQMYDRLNNREIREDTLRRLLDTPAASATRVMPELTDDDAPPQP